MRLASLIVSALLVLTAVACSGPEPGDASPSSPSSSSGASASSPAERGWRVRLTRLEDEYDARLGAVVIDTGSGRTLAHRAGERFAFASTNKTFIAAAVLRTASERELDTVVRYTGDDLLDYAPITERHVDTGMTVRALVDAALRYSDNTAANLLVERLGGPEAVQRFLRSLGDRTTSVDRVEPDLNSALPGDRRDTTTPSAFARDLRAVLLGGALPPSRRRLLESLMRANTTGDPYIRASVPSAWTVADKTGSGSYGTSNDVALVRPPGRPPLVVVLLSDSRGAGEDVDTEDALLADATRVLVSALRG